MKAKFLIILGILLFTLPINGFTVNKHSKRTRIKKSYIDIKATTRFPIDYTIEAIGDENSLQIVFLFPMHEADITLTDKNGNVVIEENQVNSPEGKTLYVHTPKAYPYTLVLTSTAVDMTDEIILEEE
ncbi:MAG: DUF3244 domain-containing protein [Bacteroides sp.]|nr:DUF3244 domain-containing protein [Bacteroides sp.]